MTIIIQLSSDTIIRKEFEMYKKSQFNNQSKQIGIIAMICGIALLISACGGSAAVSPAAPPESAPTTAPEVNPPASSNPATQSACALLSKDSVSKVLGQDIVDATESGMGGICTYTTKDLTFILTVSSTGGAKFMPETLAKLGDLALVVPGLGDQAFFNLNTNTLFALKGDAVFLFNINNSNYQYPEDGQAKQKALAEVLISNLS